LRARSGEQEAQVTRLKLAVCLAGLTVIAGSACAIHQGPNGGVMRAQDVESPMILFPTGSDGCTLSAKQSSVTAHPDKRLDFKVINYCGSPQKVVVGNFRTAETPSADTCDSPTHGGAPSVFQHDDLPRRTADLGAGTLRRPTHEKIKLKIKKNTELPGEGPLTYYFDVCLNKDKADPRLIVQR
jgi:hypothetical protein